VTAIDTKIHLGWREWVALPDLNIDRIKAKVDTGARTSALHAFEVKPVKRNGELWVEFAVHPSQKNDAVTLGASPVLDQRVVRDSGGHEEERFVIQTTLAIGSDRQPIEMTLTARDSMGFRMLLGRTAMNGRYLVDPGRSYLLGKRRPRSKGTRTSGKG